MKNLVALVVRLPAIILLFSCTQQEVNDETEILSLVFNTHIGSEEHFGAAPPVPPLPPDFDELNKYESKAEAIEKLLSRDWKDYFAEDATYDGRVRKWKERMISLHRKIIFDTNTEMSEHRKEHVLKSLDSIKYNLHFLRESKNWKLSDIKNEGKYEIVDMDEFSKVRLDTIHVGVLKFSGIGFSGNRHRAALYYDWTCGTLCGGGYVTILQKERGSWKILETLHLWVA